MKKTFVEPICEIILIDGDIITSSTPIDAGYMDSSDFHELFD